MPGRAPRAKEFLTVVGMDARMCYLPSERSGGRKRRITIARVMAKDPAILLADESTGALDSATGHMAMDICHTLHERNGKRSSSSPALGNWRRSAGASSLFATDGSSASGREGGGNMLLENIRLALWGLRADKLHPLLTMRDIIGIGVMNIMLVSTIERTREIGARKALGATNGSIRMQFVVESNILCRVGVAAGVGLGAAGAGVLEYAASLSRAAIVVAMGFSVSIGLFLGWYPANKAAKLEPIKALRYE